MRRLCGSSPPLWSSTMAGPAARVARDKVSENSLALTARRAGATVGAGVVALGVVEPSVGSTAGGWVSGPPATGAVTWCGVVVRCVFLRLHQARCFLFRCLACFLQYALLGCTGPFAIAAGAAATAT